MSETGRYPESRRSLSHRALRRLLVAAVLGFWISGVMLAVGLPDPWSLVIIVIMCLVTATAVMVILRTRA